jgi:hypothetical protein
MLNMLCAALDVTGSQEPATNGRKLLLNGTGNGGEDVVGITSNQPDSAHNDY